MMALTYAGLTLFGFGLVLWLIWWGIEQPVSIPVRSVVLISASSMTAIGLVFLGPDVILTSNDWLLGGYTVVLCVSLLVPFVYNSNTKKRNKQVVDL